MCLRPTALQHNARRGAWCGAVMACLQQLCGPVHASAAACQRVVIFSWLLRCGGLVELLCAPDSAACGWHSGRVQGLQHCWEHAHRTVERLAREVQASGKARDLAPPKTRA